MKELKNSIKSIIFDLDGTLWDPTQVIIDAWHEIISQISYIKEPVSEKDLQGIFGMQHDLIGKALFPDLTTEQQNEVMELCYCHENNMIDKIGGKLYDKLEETLIELSKKYKLFIVSNCQSGYIESFFNYHGMQKYFIDIECSGNTGKPKADNIKAIIERNRIEKPLYVGDTYGDYSATMDNNIPFIYAKYGFGDVSMCKYKIESFSELLVLV